MRTIAVITPGAPLRRSTSGHVTRPAVPDGVGELLARPDVRLRPDHDPTQLPGDPGAGADDGLLGVAGEGGVGRDEQVPFAQCVQGCGEVVARGTGVPVRA